MHKKGNIYIIWAGQLVFVFSRVKKNKPIHPKENDRLVEGKSRFRSPLIYEINGVILTSKWALCCLVIIVKVV